MLTAQTKTTILETMLREAEDSFRKYRLGHCWLSRVYFNKEEMEREVNEIRDIIQKEIRKIERDNV